MTNSHVKSGLAAGSSAFIPAVLMVLAGFVLSACEGLVDVNATATVSSRYSSVLVTVKEVWLNESATAVPDDSTWVKFELDDTRTLDLVALTGGQIARLASDINAPAGTYRQVRVFLASRDESLFDSADDRDATWNNEVTWFDEDGEERIAPLEVLNPAQGIGIEMRLEVVEVGVNLGGDSTSTAQVVFDATRDLTEFRYSGFTGFLLNPSLKAFDADEAGTISGTLNLSRLDIDTDTGRPQIQVTAQRLEESLGRHVIVGSASVRANGSFTLSPLPLDDDEDVTEFDLVIHGPGIRTIIIRDVPLEPAAGGGASITLGSIMLDEAESFEANVDASALIGQRGTRVAFYQTLPGEDEPHVIALAAVDPLTGQFAEPVALSRATTLSYGTYSSNLSLRTEAPEEGGARYAVAALSPHYGEGDFSPTLLQPASPASATATFSVPAIALPAAAASGTIAATVNVTQPGEYDRGVLIVTREGAVVAVVSLDQVLQQSLGTTVVDVNGVPAGATATTYAPGLYYLEAWSWSAADPDDTFARHSGAGSVDLRSIGTAAGSVTLD